MEWKTLVPILTLCCDTHVRYTHVGLNCDLNACDTHVVLLRVCGADAHAHFDRRGPLGVGPGVLAAGSVLARRDRSTALACGENVRPRSRNERTDVYRLSALSQARAAARFEPPRCPDMRAARNYESAPNVVDDDDDADDRRNAV